MEKYYIPLALFMYAKFSSQLYGYSWGNFYYVHTLAMGLNSILRWKYLPGVKIHFKYFVKFLLILIGQPKYGLMRSTGLAHV